MFVRLTPTSLANIFVKFAKQEALKTQISKLENQMRAIEMRLLINLKISKPEFKQVISQQIAKIHSLGLQKDKLESQLEKINNMKTPKGFFSETFGGWL